MGSITLLTTRNFANFESHYLLQHYTLNISPISESLVKKWDDFCCEQKKVSGSKTVRNFEASEIVTASIELRSSRKAPGFLRSGTLFDIRNSLIEFVLISLQCIRKTLRV